MEELIRAVLTLGAPILATEESACDAVVAIRYPNGITCRDCGAATTRSGPHVTCAREKAPHHFTILDGTPFETKLKPSVRGLLLAIQAMSSTTTSISARGLTRLLNTGADSDDDAKVKHVTLWRHLQTLRALFPPSRNDLEAPLALCLREPEPAQAAVQVTGRATSALRSWVSTPGCRIALESLRTWLNGTFHGVSAAWLFRYLDELNARWRATADVVARALVARFLVGERLPWHRVHPLRHIR